MTVVGQARTLQPDHLRPPRDVQGRALTEQDARAEANRALENEQEIANSDGCPTLLSLPLFSLEYSPAAGWGRLATSVYRLRHGRMEQGPTEPHAGRSTFLLKPFPVQQFKTL